VNVNVDNCSDTTGINRHSDTFKSGDLDLWCFGTNISIHSRIPWCHHLYQSCYPRFSCWVIMQLYIGFWGLTALSTVLHCSLFSVFLSVFSDVDCVHTVMLSIHDTLDLPLRCCWGELFSIIPFYRLLPSHNIREIGWLSLFWRSPTNFF